MIIKNFRKILKKIKFLIKQKSFFLMFNIFFKKKKNFKSLSFFLYVKKIIKKKFLLKNFTILYLLKNIGNINVCVRTNYIFNTISIIKYCIKKKINSFYNNIIYIKNLLFFIIFIKKKFTLISLTIKSKIFLNKINIKTNFALLIGNEKKSIKKKILLLFDIILKINTYCKKSLNVNVVNGILLFKL
ncbi:putative RNA methyltransferase, TrmH family [Candidatus Carsonella ruddii HT isolate Thao2000]|uniref:Putative RNA methyltransferase, TrmH family n=1 Tax=Candidatus Carsonella ruddii HT isolate Thao2000 TaxID=1202539 RepID=J3Z1G1_CARRU|nr:TrmH family RNA methyltransferase [Candidatus Carsonella ruddii]AFP84099.1 putative RNA methyltransferase, TrmH family [Candidatus Carsonella ruddii HT isolate Thao2000]